MQGWLLQPVSNETLFRPFGLMCLPSQLCRGRLLGFDEFEEHRRRYCSKEDEGAPLARGTGHTSAARRLAVRAYGDALPER